MGDTSDNLPGVKGLGPKKLYKLFPELTGDKTVTLDEIIQKGCYLVYSNCFNICYSRTSIGLVL
jgi:5'-3' exonuclease